MLLVVPQLKYLRGDSYSAEHWAELYRLLALPRGTPVEQLTLGHFVTATDLVGVHHVVYLQEAVFTLCLLLSVEFCFCGKAGQVQRNRFVPDLYTLMLSLRLLLVAPDIATSGSA